MGDAASGPTLFVATDLDRFETQDGAAFADDVTVSGRGYRRLDPPYYVWLRSKVAAAKRALDAGRLSAAAFETLREAFNAVHAWAVRHLGAAALLAASRTFDPSRYEPPRPDDDLLGLGAQCPRPPRSPAGFVFPASGTWPVTEAVGADAVAKVDAIRDEALELGWSEAALYRNRGHLAFPYGGQWGLVCFLGGDARIGSVSSEAITIERPRGATTRLANPDVAQPWRRPLQGAGLAGAAR